MPTRSRSAAKPARASSKQILLEDLTSLHLPSGVNISPDGLHVVYAEKRVGLSKNRYYQDLFLLAVVKGIRDQITEGDCSDSQPRWSADSRRIIFVSDRGKPKNNQKNLWSISPGDIDPQQLTRLNGQVHTPLWSPSGQQVVFCYAPKTAKQRSLEAGSEYAGPQYRHTTRLSYKLDGHGYWDDAWMHLYLLDIKSGKVRALTRGKFHNSQAAWSPDGKYIAFVSNRATDRDIDIANNDLFVINVKSGKLRQLTRRKGLKFAPSWSPDGKELAFIGHFSHPDWVENMHVHVISSRGGAARDLMPQSDLMCTDDAISDTKDVVEGGAPQPQWSSNGKKIAFLASVQGSVNIHEVASEGGQPVEISHGKHEIPEFSQSANAKRWAFVRIDTMNPGEVYVASRAHRDASSRGMIPGAKVERLTKINHELLKGKDVQKPSEFRIRARDSHDIHGWVLHAKGKKTRGPAILMVHGGPYAMYSYSFFHEFQMLAALGYHVFFTNIRGSAGYGREFMRAIVGKWGHGDYNDVMDVADYMEKQSYVDAGRMAIAGGSYGGFMTNWVIGRTRRFKCAITMRSISNMLSFYGASDMGWDFHEEFGSHPWENYERFWRCSPLAFAKAIRTPLLIIHSDEDHRCPVSQAEELFTALRLLRRDVEMIRFVGESHGLSRGGRPHNRLERLRRLVDWFERKL